MPRPRRRVQRQPLPRHLGRHDDAGARAGGDRLRRFLVQPLDAVGIVGVDDGAAAGVVDQRDVLADAVIAFHLEAPPVGPHRRADMLGLEQVGDLVGLDRVVEGADVIAELLAHIDDVGHLVGAVAVVLDQDVAVQHPHQRVVDQVAARCVGRLGGAGLGLARIVVPAPLVGDGVGPRLAVDGDVAHARGGRGAAAAVDPLGVLAAGHLQAGLGAGKLHVLHGPAEDVLDRHAAAAEQVGASRAGCGRW